MVCQHDILIIYNIIMQKEKSEDHRQLSNCGQCHKKTKLIEKYLHLIELLQKKNDRSNLSSTLKRSIDAGTTSNTSLLNNNCKYHKAILPMVLNTMFCHQMHEAFNNIKDIYIVSNCKKGYKFLSIMEKIIEKRRYSFGKIFFVEKKNKQIGNQNYLFATQRNSKISHQKSLNNTNSICSVTCFLEAEKKQKIKRLTRKVFELQKQLDKMKFQKKLLDQQVDENFRRQQVESKKKKESLQMLAEQMNEKNEIINQLQSNLRYYEAKFGNFQNNVLQEDSLSMKKEIDRLEKLIEKFNIQTEKKNEAIEKLVSQSKIYKEKLLKIELQHNELKQKNFQMGVQLQNIQRKKKQCNNLSLFLQKKLTNLKKYEKMISNNLKVIDQCSLIERSSFNSSIKARNGKNQFDTELGSQNNINNMQMSNFKEIMPISSFESQYKIQKILNYLYNIESEDFDLNNEQKLFDNEEYNVLVEVKNKYIQIKNSLKDNKESIKEIQKYQIIEDINMPNRQMKQCGDNDEIYFNQGHVSGSIFEVFATERAHKDRQNGVKVSGFESNGGKKSSQQSHPKMDQGFTIRLLQMQIQKNKQIEKISELKNKVFHIRSIVMNLIKSLQMKLLKPQSKDIVDLCLEFFEYSEEEKQTIFHTQKKEKKFLGWF